jgi:hypothetical protein
MVHRPAPPEDVEVPPGADLDAEPAESDRQRTSVEIGRLRTSAYDHWRRVRTSAYDDYRRTEREALLHKLEVDAAEFDLFETFEREGLSTRARRGIVEILNRVAPSAAKRSWKWTEARIRKGLKAHVVSAPWSTTTLTLPKADVAGVIEEGDDGGDSDRDLVPGGRGRSIPRTVAYKCRTLDATLDMQFVQPAVGPWIFFKGSALPYKDPPGHVGRCWGPSWLEGDAWAKTEAIVRAQPGCEDVNICAVCFSSDWSDLGASIGSRTGAARGAHPVYCAVMNGHPQRWSDPEWIAHVADVPLVPHPTRYSRDRQPGVNCMVLQAVYDQVLTGSTFMRLGTEGGVPCAVSAVRETEVLRFTPDGKGLELQRMRVCTVLVVCVGDVKEMWRIMGVHGSHLLTHVRMLADSSVRFDRARAWEWRTPQSQARAHLACVRAPAAERRALCQSLGVIPALARYADMHGFHSAQLPAGLRVLDLVRPGDHLHEVSKGVIQGVIRRLRAKCSPEQAARTDAALVEVGRAAAPGQVRFCGTFRITSPKADFQEELVAQWWMPWTPIDAMWTRALRALAYVAALLGATAAPLAVADDELLQKVDACLHSFFSDLEAWLGDDDDDDDLDLRGIKMTQVRTAWTATFRAHGGCHQVNTATFESAHKWTIKQPFASAPQRVHLFNLSLVDCSARAELMRSLRQTARCAAQDTRALFRCRVEDARLRRGHPTFYGIELGPLHTQAHGVYSLLHHQVPDPSSACVQAVYAHLALRGGVEAVADPFFADRRFNVCVSATGDTQTVRLFHNVEVEGLGPRGALVPAVFYGCVTLSGDAVGAAAVASEDAEDRTFAVVHRYTEASPEALSEFCVGGALQRAGPQLFSLPGLPDVADLLWRLESPGPENVRLIRPSQVEQGAQLVPLASLYRVDEVQRVGPAPSGSADWEEAFFEPSEVDLVRELLGALYIRNDFAGR